MAIEARHGCSLACLAVVFPLSMDTHVGVSSPSLSSRHRATSSGVSTLSWSSSSKDDSEELDRLLEDGLGPERKEAWGLDGLEELRMESGAAGRGSEEGAWSFSTHLDGGWERRQIS